MLTLQYQWQVSRYFHRPAHNLRLNSVDTTAR